MGDTTGIDLSDAETYGLITRIFWSRIAPQAAAGGLDPEDVLQDLLIRLMRTNDGTAPFDPDRASLSTFAFVNMVSGLRNAIESKRRAERRGWVTGEEDMALSYSASVEAEVEDTEVWHSGVVRAIESGVPAPVAALQGLTDSVEALLLAQALRAPRRPPRGRRRPRRRSPKMIESRTVVVPMVLGPWELVELGQVTRTYGS